MDYKIVLENLRSHFKDYMTTSGLKSVVLGVSGGIDSALVAAIVKPVCDELNTPLYGRSISIGSNKLDEQERARNIGAQFVSDFKEVDLCVFHEFCKTQFENVEGRDDEGFGAKVRAGNSKARIRMMYLYDLAHRKDGMVLGTDNLTEWYTNFYTIGGDGTFDYCPISYLWKTEVYALANYIADNELTSDAAKEALRACIDAKPTDGLGITDSDLEQLEADSYDEVDKVLKSYLSGSTEDEITSHPVVERHNAGKFKMNLPVKISREDTLKNAL